MTAYRTALVTGASSGIGQALALWFHARGTKVLAAARRIDRLQALAQAHEGIVPVELDIAREDETVARMQSLDDEHGGIDLVIANAGVGGPTPGDLATWREVEAVLRVNVTGTAATITALLPRMVKRGRGHVVAVSSCAGYVGLGAYSSYSASKAFVSTFMQSLRVDLVRTGVKVTCIEPGFVKSEMSARVEGHAPMPFIAETDVAADVFGRAILRGARTIAYPRVHAIASRAIACIPQPIYEPLARRASESQRRMLELESPDRE
jgi:short-subunit dehydrogenase